MNNSKVDATIQLSDGTIVDLRKPNWREAGFIVNQLVTLTGNMYDPFLQEYVLTKATGWTVEDIDKIDREDVDKTCLAAMDLAFDKYTMNRISSYKKKFEEILSQTTFGTSNESSNSSSENQDSPEPTAKS